MKVYSLIEFVDYGGLDLVGVFGSVEDVMKCVEEGVWSCDHLGYVVSELGQKVDVRGEVVYVSFVLYNGKVRSVD